MLIEVKENIQSGTNRLFIDKFGKLFIDSSFSFYDIIELQLTRQQLIMISLDPNEEIEVGDKYLDDCELIREAFTNDKDYWSKRPEYQKIITTQDQLSFEYIKQFIEEYNRGEVKDIEVEKVFILDTICSKPCSQQRVKLVDEFVNVIDKNKTKLQLEFEKQTPTIKNIKGKEYLQVYCTWLEHQLEKNNLYGK